MTKFCENCGNKIIEGADICLNCGKIINNSQIPKYNYSDSYDNITIKKSSPKQMDLLILVLFYH